jgi:large subunit ribosomal protein LP0
MLKFLQQAGEKVGNSEAALLTKLNIRPFSYGLKIDSIFEQGSMFSVDVLDIDDAQLIAKFSIALNKVASLSLQIGMQNRLNWYDFQTYAIL